jgi:hypothetical protein
MGDNCRIHNDGIAMARNERADVEPDAGTRRRNDIPLVMAVYQITHANEWFLRHEPLPRYTLLCLTKIAVKRTFGQQNLWNLLQLH